MASYTSAAAGDVATATNWTPNGVPGDGDDVTITHVMTSGAWTIGTGGVTGTAAITLSPGGSLSMSDALTLKGDVVAYDNTTFNHQDVIFRAPTGARYRIYYNGLNSGTTVYAVAGTIGTRYSLTSDNTDGGSNGYVEIDSASDVAINWDYFDWTDIGDATQNALISNMGSGAGDWTWDYGKVQTCGQVAVTVNSTTNIFRFNGLDFREPANNTFLYLIGNSALTTGTRELTSCTSFKSGVTLSFNRWLRDLTYDGNVFASTALTNLDRNGLTASNNMYLMERFMTSEGAGAANDMVIEECSFISDCANPHFITEAGNGLSGPNQYRYNIFDGFDNISGDFGDLVILNRRAIIKYNLAVATAGTLATLFNTTGIAEDISHNTCYGSRPINVGETTGAATQIETVRSNLFVSQIAGITQDTGFVTQTNMTLNNNGFYDMTDATNIDHPVLLQNSYLGAESVAVWRTGFSYGDANFGATDIYGDPGFIDSTRTAANWDIANGGAGTLANIIAETLKLNGFDSAGNAATFDSNYSNAKFKAYMRAGFAPTNTLYKDAGHDGITVGALELALNGGTRRQRQIKAVIARRRREKIHRFA